MTKSLEDYIEIVYVLIHEKNRARVRDIAMEHILSAETMDKIRDFLKKGPPNASSAKATVSEPA